MPPISQPSNIALLSPQLEDFINRARLYAVNIDVDDVEITTAQFMGLVYALQDCDKRTICTIPYHPTSLKLLQNYKQQIKLHLPEGYKLKKAGLYRQPNGAYFIVLKIKAVTYRLTLMQQGDPIPETKNPVMLQVIKELEEPYLTFGTIIENDKGIWINPLLFFNQSHELSKINQFFISLSSFFGRGRYADGTMTIGQHRKVNLDFISHRRSFEFRNDVPLHHNYYLRHIYPFVAHKHTLTEELDGEFFKKSFFMGDGFDERWFGREFGFWHTTASKRVVRFYTMDYRNHGRHVPLNELA